MNLFQIISTLGIIGTVSAAAVHYKVFGPKHPEVADDECVIKRFSAGERLMHLMTLAGFVMLALTGFASAVCLGKPLAGWLRVWHIGAAMVFLVGLGCMALRWAEDSRFAEYDWDWAKKFGGYLGGDVHTDAGRFNGGQKAFFWAICGLAILIILSGLGRAYPLFDEDIQRIIYEVHRYASLMALMAVIVHMYLGSFANPGTIKSVITGRVSRRWAQHHHSVWWKEIERQKQNDS